MPKFFCDCCGIGLRWTENPIQPLCGDCRIRREKVRRFLIASAIAAARRDMLPGPASN